MKRDNLKVLVAVTLPVLAFVYVHVRSYWLFAQIELGSAKEVVTATMGEPDKDESHMLFCDGFFEWDGECPTQHIPSFSFYRRGLDRWIVVGFDVRNQVVFRTMGDL